MRAQDQSAFPGKITLSERHHISTYAFSLGLIL